MKVLQTISVIAMVLLAGCGQQDSHRRPPDPAASAITVDAVSLSPTEWPDFYEAPGTVRAKTSAVISSKMIAYVRDVKVRPGDHVRQGQLLVALDGRDLDASYRQAEAALSEARSATVEVENAVSASKANLELAEVTFRRIQDLFSKRSISNQEFDEVSARLKLARANHEMSQSRRAQLSFRIQQAEQGLRGAGIGRAYAELRAPFSGTVIEKIVEPGNLATPGAPLLVLAQQGTWQLEASVEESRLPLVRVGETAAVAIDAIHTLDNNIEGRVTEVVPAVDPASRAFFARLDLPPITQLRSGLFGRARFVAGRRKVLGIPAGAVTERGQLQTVFVAEGGWARTRLITVGERSGEQVEVLSGLSAGDAVIFPAPGGLADGASIKVRSQRNGGGAATRNER